MDYKEAAALLGRWNNILILTHKRPDGDTIGCAVGLCALLRQVGKTCWVLKSEDATARLLAYMEGYVAPDDFVPDKVVSVDIAGVGLMPDNAMKWYERGIDLALDHHPSHEDFAQYNCVEADKAACGELIFKLVEELGTLTVEIATPLYLAVSTDTGCYVYSNTTGNSHLVTARLMELPIPYQSMNKAHFRTKSMPRFKMEGTLINNMESLEDGTIVISSISRAEMEAMGATEEDAENIAGFLGQIEGVQVSATIREMPGGECKVSLRTGPSFLNASETCALLGGGGHAAAAGCSIRGSVDEARAAIRGAILKTLHGA